MVYVPVSGQLAIVGAGGFGRECLDIIEALNAGGAMIDFVGYFDDGGGDAALLARRGVACLGSVDRLPAARCAYVIAIGSGLVRRGIDEMLTASGIDAAILVHPQATLGSDCRVLPGTILNAGARVTTNVSLGRHVQVHCNASVGHDATLDDYVSVFPGATISGSVHLEHGVTVGTGANVLPGVRVGAGTMIGAGAVVTRDTPAGATMVGVPATPLRTLNVPSSSGSAVPMDRP